MTIINYKSKEYRKHPIFNRLKKYKDFYKSLSYTIMCFITMGTKAILNIDTYVYLSMSGSIESIYDMLIKGKISDSYTILRKLHDISIINIYSNLYIKENYSLENLNMDKINKWIDGKDSFTNFERMIKYIEKSEKLKDITNLLKKDDRYIKIRNRCSHYTHYNSYRDVIRNAGEVYLPKTKEELDIFLFAIDSIFIQHVAYMFFLYEHYMGSTEYGDYLDCGGTPPEDCQYWVAPFIQKIFDDIIKIQRSDIYNKIKETTVMQLK